MSSCSGANGEAHKNLTSAGLEIARLRAAGDAAGLRRERAEMLQQHRIVWLEAGQTSAAATAPGYAPRRAVVGYDDPCGDGVAPDA